MSATQTPGSWRLRSHPRRRVMWALLWGFFVVQAALGCQLFRAQDDDDPGGDPREAKASKQERLWKEKAMYALGRGEQDAERKIWQTLLKHKPQGSYAGMAHMRLALLAFQKKRWDAAQRHLIAAQKHPLSPEEQHRIRLQRGEVMLKQKRYDAALTYLAGVQNKLPSRLRTRALTLLVKAAKGAKKPGHALRWQVASIPFLEKDKRDKMRQTILRKVVKLNAKQLQVLYRRGKGKASRFPHLYVAYRLAWLHYDQDRYKQAKTILKPLAGGVPLSHPLGRKIGKLFAEVNEVKRPCNPRTIGVIYPQTGRGQLIGQQVRRGIEAAVVYAPQVRLVYLDSGSSPARAVQAVDTLVKHYKAIAIFGPPLKETAIAAAKRAQALGVPLFSITPHEGFADLGSFVFQNHYTLSQMARASARYAFNHLRIKRFGIFYPESNYGKLQAKAFFQELKRIGAVPTSAMHYSPEATDFQLAVKLLIGTSYENSDQLALKLRMMKGLKTYQKIRLRKKVAKMLKPLLPFEALFIPDTYKVASQITPQLAYYNVLLKPIQFTPEQYYSPSEQFRAIQLIGNNQWYHKDLYRAGYKYVRGAIFGVRFFRESFRPVVQNFVTAFQRTHQKPPHLLSAYAFDTMRVLSHIVMRKRPRNRVRFRKALLKIRDFHGPTGPMTIQKNGETLAPVRFLIAFKKSFRLHGVLKW